MKSTLLTFCITLFQFLGLSQQVETHIQYDVFDRITNTWNSLGQRSIVVYDKKGNITQRATFGPATIDLPNSIGKIVVGRTSSIPVIVSHGYLPITNISTRAISSPLGVSNLGLLGDSTNRTLMFVPKKKGGIELSVIATDGFVSSTNNISLTAVD